MFKTMRNKIDNIREIKRLQGQALETQGDNYMVGLYNGLEFALSILEDREPEFAYTVNDPEVKEMEQEQEEEQEIGRTITSGIRKKGSA